MGLMGVLPMPRLVNANGRWRFIFRLGDFTVVRLTQPVWVKSFFRGQEVQQNSVRLGRYSYGHYGLYGPFIFPWYSQMSFPNQMMGIQCLYLAENFQPPLGWWLEPQTGAQAARAATAGYIPTDSVYIHVYIYIFIYVLYIIFVYIYMII